MLPFGPTKRESVKHEGWGWPYIESHRCRHCRQSLLFIICLLHCLSGLKLLCCTCTVQYMQFALFPRSRNRSIHSCSISTQLSEYCCLVRVYQPYRLWELYASLRRYPSPFDKDKRLSHHIAGTVCCQPANAIIKKLVAPADPRSRQHRRLIHQTSA